MHPYKMNPHCGYGAPLANPSGLFIGGLVAALAAAGGAAWWFTRPKAGGGVDLFELDQSLVAQLSAEQKDQIRQYFPNLAIMVASSDAEAKSLMIRAKNNAMEQMIRPVVYKYDSAGYMVSEGRASPADAQALVSAGTHRWNVEFPSKRSVYPVAKPSPNKGKK
jgi:hypothetical protein